MNQCLKCSSPLFGDVKFCPYCGKGTGPAASSAAPAEEAAPVSAAPVVPAAPTVWNMSESPAMPPEPVPAPAAPAVVRSKAKRPAAAPAPTAPQAVVQQVPAAAPIPVSAPTPPPGTKGGKGKWILGGIVVLLVLLYNNGKPDTTQVDCDSAFDLGTKAVAAGDLVAAREQALRANAVCVDRARGKAEALQSAITAAETTDNDCLRSFRTIESLIQDHRLGGARENLNQLTAACSANEAATQLRNQLGEAQAAGQAAQAEIRSALEAGDAVLAKVALVKLAGINRDDPDLEHFKGEVEALTVAGAVAAEAAAAAAAAPAAAEPVRPVEEAAPVSAPPQRPVDTSKDTVVSRSAESNAAQKSSMASLFLRDAEQALLQRKFDAAKTYVESARRIDPDNPRLDSLMQTIRERERQMLQQETTIK